MALGLSRYDASLLTAERAISTYYESVVALGADPKKAANWIINDLFKQMNRSGLEREAVDQTKVTPERLAALIKLIDAGTISVNAGRTVFAELYDNGGDPAQIVADRGLAQVSDDSAIRSKVREVLDSSPAEVARYVGGEEKVAKMLMGMTMKLIGKGGNPALIQKILTEELDARKPAEPA